MINSDADIYTLGIFVQLHEFTHKWGTYTFTHLGVIPELHKSGKNISCFN